MKKKYGKKVKAYFSKLLDGETFEVYVLDDDASYNVHVLSEKYRGYGYDELDTMRQQISKELVKNADEYFTESYMMAQLIEFFVWDKFYEDLMVKGLTVSVTAK